MGSGQSRGGFEPGSFTAVGQTTGATATTLRVLKGGLPGVYDCILRYVAQDAANPIVPGKVGLAIYYHATFTLDGSGNYVAIGITALDTQTDGTFVSALTLSASAAGVAVIATSATAVIVVSHLAFISVVGPVY